MCWKSIFVGLLIALQAPAMAQTVKAKKPRFSSVYTLLKDCKLPVEQTGTEPSALCKPVGGYTIHIDYNATLASVSVWDSAGKEVAKLGTDYIAIGMQREAVEWRLANGRPFAVIYKIGSFDTSGYAATNSYKAFNVKRYDFVAKGLHGYESIDYTMEIEGPQTAVVIRRKVDEAYTR